MTEVEKYAILTARHDAFGTMDIRVSRDILIKDIIAGLFDALSCNKKILKGYYAKADIAQILLRPTDTLRGKDVYDGDVLRIL